MDTSASALILVDHGSRSAAANELVHDLCRLIVSTTNGRFVAVEPAHMELALPSVRDAVARCVEAGAQQIVVSLVFLAAGRHSSKDVPALVAAALSDHPGVRWTVTPPLGTHSGLVQALLGRIEETMGTQRDL